MTAKDLDGKTIFQTSKFYSGRATDSRSTQTALGPENKLGLIRDTSIQPFAPKEETIEASLPPGLRDAVIEVNLSYLPRPNDIYPIHNVVRKVSLDRTK